jgi:predicted ATPase
MITRLEATRYRCFERLAIDLSEFQVIVGVNGAGKTTLLDIPVLFGDLLRANHVGSAFSDKRFDLSPRAGNLRDILFAGRGIDFSLVLEAILPEDIANDVRNGAIVRLISPKAKEAFSADEQRWPTHLRYEVSFELTDDNTLQARNEYLFLFPKEFAPERSAIELYGAQAKDNKNWIIVLSRDTLSGTEISPEAPTKRRRRPEKIDIPSTVLALPRVLYESSSEYPAARWLYKLLTAESVFLDPNWAEMRLASRPGQPKTIISSARNIPWLALDLKREGMAEGAEKNYRSENYKDWIAHVKTALPQVEDIDVREREDDHHAYFNIRYVGGYKVPSSGLSDGTLRILTLTLLPYLAKTPNLIAVEEPENGIHPQAIMAVMQSLSSLYHSQVLVSSHSPIVLADTRKENLLCSQLSRSGGVEIITGDKHPHLQSWRGEISLGTLFAAGVLG